MEGESASETERVKQTERAQMIQVIQVKANSNMKYQISY